MRPELVPLLLVAILMLSAGGADVDQARLVLDGDHAIEDLEYALLVGEGTVSVPEGGVVSGPVYVLGGEVTVDGTVEGDVVVLGGDLRLGETATVTGTLRALAGGADVAPGAAVAARTVVEPTAGTGSPVASLVLLAVQSLALALGGGWLARRDPALLANVGDAITEHGLVSGTVGVLTAVSFLALFVFMAFTLVLIPVSLLGLAVGLVVVSYGYVAFGYLLGRRAGIERDWLAAAAGVVAFSVALALLGRVPVVGAPVALALTATGLGAVVVTYFGLREFEPVSLPD